MKKIFAIILTIALLLGFSSVALAAQNYSGSADNAFFSTSHIEYVDPQFGRDTNSTVSYAGASYTDYTSRIYCMPTTTAKNSACTPAMNTIFSMTPGSYQWGYIGFYSPVDYYKFKATNMHSGYAMTITGSYDVWSN